MSLYFLSFFFFSRPLVLVTSLACRSCPDSKILRTKHQIFQIRSAIKIALLQLSSWPTLGSRISTIFGPLAYETLIILQTTLMKGTHMLLMNGSVIIYGDKRKYFGTSWYSDHQQHDPCFPLMPVRASLFFIPVFPAGSFSCPQNLALQ